MKRLTWREDPNYVRRMNCRDCLNSENCKDIFDCSHYATDRLATIEDILDDDYDLDHLRKLVQADREGRCFISDVKLGDEVFYIPKYNGKSLAGIKKGHVQAVSFTKAGKRVRLREYREFNKDFMLGKSAFTTREAAEKALEEEKHG